MTAPPHEPVFFSESTFKKSSMELPALEVSQWIAPLLEINSHLYLITPLSLRTLKTTENINNSFTLH